MTALTDEQIGAYTGWLVYAAIPDGEALLEFNAWYAAVVARAKREALAEASTLSGDQAVEAARYVLDLLRGESGLPDPDTLALAIEYTAGVVAVHAKREERERIAAQLESWAEGHKKSGNTEHFAALHFASFMVHHDETNWPSTESTR